MNDIKALEAYNALLASLPPEVATIVKSKMEDDALKFQEKVELLERDKPLSFWAKYSCTKCHGRGIIGKRLVFTGDASVDSSEASNVDQKVDVPCTCVSRGKMKWLKDLRLQYNRGEL